MLEDGSLAAMAALPTPLPTVPEDQVFTEAQWTVLLSLCETFVPSLNPSLFNSPDFEQARSELQQILPENVESGILDKYLAESVAGSKAFKESLRARFAVYVPKAQNQGLAFLMSALDTKFGSLTMTGSATPIYEQSLETRTRIVLSWANSYLGPLRALYKAVEFVTKATWLAQSECLHAVLDYPKIPRDIERHPSYDFKFLDFSNSPDDTPVQVDADIVIVGSGCGAGVMADHLAANLKDIQPKPRILVLEKGYHFPSSHFPMDQSASGVHLQESGGGVLSDDGSIAVLAGSTWGGGGTINWSASLQPKAYVRKHWSESAKLPFIKSQEFQACLDEVCDRMGVCRMNDIEGLQRIEHNFANQALLEGSRRLGLTAQVVPQNTAGKRHYCGRCNFGCAGVTKQGPANLWLPAAAENGVEFIEGCFAEKIRWDDNISGARAATGVNVIWTSRARDVTRKLSINAKRVIVSSGTLHSPLLLHRSGLTPEVNKHIGSNLHLHPVLTTRGTYKDRVNPWDGAILTSAMTSLENMDGTGHGPTVEVVLGTPDLTCTVAPFRPSYSLSETTSGGASLKSALDYKVRVAKHGYSFGLISIQRDHADPSNLPSSYVYNDRDDPRKVKINYTTSPKDREAVLAGAKASASIHFVMGAGTIEICSPDIPIFQRPSLQNPNATPDDDKAAFDQWLGNLDLSRVTNPGIFGSPLLDPKVSRLGSAHQMGSCRMSGNPQDGVVDQCGKVWGTRNVYVADASILPGASGVNPMVSTMGLSLHVAKALVKELKAEK